MSLASLLLAFAPALAARFRPEKDETEARIAGLEIDLADARRAADEWRQRCGALEIHIERLMRREAPVQRAPNPLATPWQQQEAVAEQYRYQQAAQNLMAQQMQAQAWQAQQNQQLSQYQGLLGAQGQLSQLEPSGGVFDHLPNCTPSRGDVLTGRLNHP
jgi:chromosome condensin MukBEF ATPase and DNA-binding subunit MukB